MPMSDKDQDLGGLGAFFDAARAHPPAPSPDLLARVLGDAEAEQVWITRRAQPAAEAPRAGLLEQLYRLLGGWPAMAGLTTAIVAGVWIGTALPEGVSGGTEAAYLVDITPEAVFELAGDF
ncbi:hypothetical protein [uncultured Roseovarius sp.]|uniref:hypothetical protein n=1 Tax=uncultured Roseovarius sp. TaxID=293344 RepID=UPI0030D7D41F|tara:strand:- start:65 stop:427 length:363 start_codon:yes stop_codon:yes gene_type:complete